MEAISTDSSYDVCRKIVDSWIDSFGIDDDLVANIKDQDKQLDDYYNIIYKVEIEGNNTQIIEFIEVNVQFDGELCGFHALYNLVQFSLLLTSQTHKDKLKYGKILTNPVK